MEERKIKVGITHGDITGIGYEVILKTFADPAMFDLCTPVIYGSPKVAAYHRKAMDIPTNFSIVASAADAQEGKLNIVNLHYHLITLLLRKMTGLLSFNILKTLPLQIFLHSIGITTLFIQICLNIF